MKLYKIQSSLNCNLNRTVVKFKAINNYSAEYYMYFYFLTDLSLFCSFHGPVALYFRFVTVAYLKEFQQSV